MEQTYNEFIQNIIETRGQWSIPDGEYFEKHHINPRCMGGEDIKENLIWLYPQEHYTAHKLLAKENPDNYSLIYAWFMMSHIRGDKIIVDPEEYAESRKKWVEIMRVRNSGPKSEEIKSRMLSKRLNTMSNWSEEFREDIKKSKQKSWEGKKWFTNGVISDRFVPGTEPDGWVLGRDCNFIENSKVAAKKRVEDAGPELITEWHRRSVESQKKMSKEQIALKKKKEFETWMSRPEEIRLAKYKKISEANSGGNNPGAIKVRCIETNMVYGCKKDASKESNVSIYRINKSIQTGLADKFGNHWEVID